LDKLVNIGRTHSNILMDGPSRSPYNEHRRIYSIDDKEGLIEG
jgi:hypothetical protein